MKYKTIFVTTMLVATMVICAVFFTEYQLSASERVAKAFLKQYYTATAENGATAINETWAVEQIHDENGVLLSIDESLVLTDYVNSFHHFFTEQGWNEALANRLPMFYMQYASLQNYDIYPQDIILETANTAADDDKTSYIYTVRLKIYDNNSRVEHIIDQSGYMVLICVDGKWLIDVPPQPRALSL